MYARERVVQIGRVELPSLAWQASVLAVRRNLHIFSRQEKWVAGAPSGSRTHRFPVLSRTSLPFLYQRMICPKKSGAVGGTRTRMSCLEGSDPQPLDDNCFHVSRTQKSPCLRMAHLLSGVRRQTPLELTKKARFGAEGQDSHLHSPSVEGHLALEDFRTKKWWSRGESNSCWSGENRVS